MRLSLLFFGCAVAASVSAAADRSVRITAAKSAFPAMQAIVIVRAGEPAPGVPNHRAIALGDRYDQWIKLADEGPFDIWWQPKSGMPVRIASGVKINDNEAKEWKLDEVLGIVNVRGDDLPRAALITIAPQDDPGPDEKGHLPIQIAKAYRTDMAAPEGVYSLWVTPDNGARSRKVNDRFRVHAGKTLLLD